MVCEKVCLDCSHLRFLGTRSGSRLDDFEQLIGGAGVAAMRVEVGRHSIDPRDVAGVTRGAGARGLELTVHCFPPKKVRPDRAMTPC
jgi:hypothetical protein